VCNNTVTEFDDLAEALFCRDSDYILMLLAYFDESGTHSGSKVVSFAGYISTVEKWRQFNILWQAMLDLEGISMMHWCDLESRKGIFNGWSQDRKITVQKAAISIFKTTILHGFTTSIVTDDYAEVIEMKPHLHFSSPYVLAMVGTLHLVKKWLKDNNVNETVSYFLEYGSGFENETHSVVNQAEEVKEAFYNMKSLTFAKKSDILPLQAADILAYESYKHMLNDKVGDVRRGLRKSLETILRSVPHSDQFFNKETILKLHAFVGME